MALGFVRASSQYVSLASTFQSLSGATITGWAKITSFVGDQYVMHFSNASGTSFTRLGLRSTSAGFFQGLARRLDTDGATTITESTTRSTGVLYFVALVARYTTQSFELYVNASLAASATPASWTAASDGSAGLAAIGGSASAANFQNGVLQDVRFYNTALSSGEIATLYAAMGDDTVQLSNRKHQFLMGLTTGTAGTVTDTGTAAINGAGVNSPAYQGQIVPAAAIAETIDVSDSTTVELLTPGVDVSDTISVSDSGSTEVFYERAGSDSVSVSEQLLVETCFPEDSISVTDQSTVDAVYARSAADTIDLTDSVEATVGSVVDVSIGDTIGITDAQATDVWYARSPSDAIDVSDEVEASVGSTIDVALSDTIGITDAGTTETSYVRSASDTVSTSDQAAASLDAGREASDTISITDQATTSLEAGVAVSDTISTSDVAATSTDYTRSGNDSVALTDQLITWADYFRSASDAEDVTDSVTAEIVEPFIDVVVSDAVQMADSVLPSTWVPDFRMPPERTIITDYENRTVLTEWENRTVV